MEAATKVDSIGFCVHSFKTHISINLAKKTKNKTHQQDIIGKCLQK